jgi:hypothetical protein
VQVLHDTFADDDKVRVLAAHMGAGDPRMEGAETLDGYADTHGFTYPVIEDGRSIGEAFDIPGIPYFLVVGPDGAVVTDHRGQLTDEARARLAKAARGARPRG